MQRQGARMTKDSLMTPDELSERLNVSKKFIEKYMALRRLPGMVKIGGIYRFRRADIEKRLTGGEFLLPERGRKK
jgi:excisionase family DNA binding protein